MTVATGSATCRWGDEMKVTVSYICPPIPIRSMDWTAYMENDAGNENSIRGFGFTKLEALEDLLMQFDAEDAEAKAVWDEINRIERQW